MALKGACPVSVFLNKVGFLNLKLHRNLKIAVSSFISTKSTSIHIGTNGCNPQSTFTVLSNEIRLFPMFFSLKMLSLIMSSAPFSGLSFSFTGSITNLESVNVRPFFFEISPTVFNKFSLKISLFICFISPKEITYFI